VTCILNDYHNDKQSVYLLISFSICLIIHYCSKIPSDNLLLLCYSHIIKYIKPVSICCEASNQNRRKQKLLNSKKNLKVFALIFIISAVVITAAASNIAIVKAQSQGTIDMFAAIGGTTDPDVGTANYPAGDVTLTATPGPGFVFTSWEIATAEGGTEDLNNPTTLTVVAGTEYAVQPVFSAIQQAIPSSPTTDYTHAAIVVVLAAVGGTTDPVPGTYALANAASFNLKATPSTGFVFDHWVIGGSLTGHGAYSFTATPTDNPYNVNHGYGNTYSYQPVFRLTSSPSPTVPELSSVAIIVALIGVTVGTFAYKRKTK
jgi:hypothetical protein